MAPEGAKPAPDTQRRRPMSEQELNQRPEGSMLAAVMYGARDVRLEQRPIPKVGPEEVLVKIVAIGVCGSDVHFYWDGRIGKRVVRKPMILGHESAGIVVAVGENVTLVKVGDRVALEPGIPCRRCSYCKTGHYNLCPDVAFMAAPHTDGAMREYFKTPEDLLFKLPDNMSFEDGTLVEPLSVGVYAARRGRIVPGDRVVILGAGTIGLMVLQAVKVYGAARRVVIDLQADRLEMAKKLGATEVINPREQDPDKIIEELMPGGCDVVMEAAGAVPTIQMATRLVRKGGRIVFLGMPGVDEVPVNMLDIIVKEVDVMGMFRYNNVYGEAVRMISEGLVEVRSLHTHTYPLEQAAEAIEKAHACEVGTIKVIIKP